MPVKEQFKFSNKFVLLPGSLLLIYIHKLMQNAYFISKYIPT